MIDQLVLFSLDNFLKLNKCYDKLKKLIGLLNKV